MKNILYLHCHDLGRWLGCYDRNIASPHLDRLAASGVLFENAFCVAPTCSPSRAAMLTGESAHESGMLGLAHRGFSLKHPDRHLVPVLKKAGYRTYLSGIEHEGGVDYDVVLPNGDTPFVQPAWDRAAGEAAARFLSESHEGPFFLSCGFFRPHRQLPEAAAGEESDEPLHGLMDTAETCSDSAAFRKAVRLMDQHAGLVLDALARGPHADDTIILFTTDHGPAFPQMKCNLFDRGLEVALVFAGPGLPAGRRVKEMVTHLDVFPTLCDWLKLPHPDWLQGCSLSPLIEGKADAERPDHFFAEVTHHAEFEPMRSVRTLDYKLIVHLGRARPEPKNCDRSPSKEAYASASYFDEDRPTVMLFDLRKDPGEQINRAAEAGYKDIRDALLRKLGDWMLETGDPMVDRFLEVLRQYELDTVSAQ